MTIKNSSYVFNLDKQIENNGKAIKNDQMQELDFVESTDQLDSLENFVNTGMNLT